MVGGELVGVFRVSMSQYVRTYVEFTPGSTYSERYCNGENFRGLTDFYLFRMENFRRR